MALAAACLVVLTLPGSLAASSLGATAPGDLLGENWRLTLPIDTPHAGSPDEIRQPELATFSLDPFFQLTPAGDGVVFSAHAGGATTSGSTYPRSELRETTNAGRTLARWSSSSGTHTMTIRQAITQLPVVKPQVVAGQIHGTSTPVIKIRLNGKRLFAEARGGGNLGDLDTDYRLGTVFTVQLIVAADEIRVLYNGVRKVSYAMQDPSLYFKAGCYTQSNTTKGDDASAYGEVVVYGLTVTHE